MRVNRETRDARTGPGLGVHLDLAAVAQASAARGQGNAQGLIVGQFGLITGKVNSQSPHLFVCN
jgi:hypothetical protein